MNDTVRSALFEGLKLYEASVKRMQTAKPQFQQIFQEELQKIAEARAYVTNAKKL